MKTRKKITKKSDHHLWQSTATSDGDVTIQRTKAEREDLEEFEFFQAKSATLLGLWGASMTDSPLFSRIPARSAKTFEKAAKDMQAEGEVPPRVMTWKKLSTAFGADKVKDCRELIQFGMKTRLASKELNVPFVMAADIVEDWEKVGGKVLAEIVEFVKEGQEVGTGSSYVDVNLAVEDFIRNAEAYAFGFFQEAGIDESSPEGEELYSIIQNEIDNLYSSLKLIHKGFMEGKRALTRTSSVSQALSNFMQNLDNLVIEFFSNQMDESSSMGIAFAEYMDNAINNLEDKLNENLARTPEGPVQASSEYPKSLVAEVKEVLSSPNQKVAIDQSAEDYYKAYFGPYGAQLVKEVKKRVKADLAKVWLIKQGVDQAAAEYWSSYYTDQNYGELMVAEPKKRPSVTK